MVGGVDWRLDRPELRHWSKRRLEGQLSKFNVSHIQRLRSPVALTLILSVESGNTALEEVMSGLEKGNLFDLPA